MLSIRLNEIITAKANELTYTVRDNAPSTFEELMQYGLIIWSGASDNTIYADPKVNHMFRAWHDSLHIKLNAPFTLQGEIYVATEQARQVGSDILAEIILAEVKGQAEYFDKHGEFPVNQISFIKQYLNIK